MEGKNLLYSLRSKCYPANMNFCKQFKENLHCRSNCNAKETQDHILLNCGPIQIRVTYPVKLSDIYGTLDEQIRLVQTLIEIDMVRKSMKNNILPGGSAARTNVDT